MTATDLATAASVKQWLASARLESEPPEELVERLARSFMIHNVAVIQGGAWRG